MAGYIEADTLHRGPEVKEVIDFLTYGLKQTPEFLSALGVEYFEHTGVSEGEKNPIKFEKDGQEYEVLFESKDYPDYTTEETLRLRRGKTNLFLQASYDSGGYKYFLGRAILDDGVRRLEDTDAIIEVRKWFPEFYNL